MKLSKLSLIFSAVLLLILGINGSISTLVLSTFDTVQAVQQNRADALRQVDDLRREMDMLSRLVRSYAVTGEPRYLTYYYAILAIREGERPPVVDDHPATYWERVLAGTTPFVQRDAGPGVSLRARMIALGFDGAELEALQAVLAEAEALKAIEQVAFAATQGLYDPKTGAFVSEGVPRPDMAIRFVHSRDYDIQRARMAQAVAALKERVDRRTGAAVADARGRLRDWIVAAIVGMVVTALFVIRGYFTVRRRVLQPIDEMCAATGRLARGEYDTRIPAADGVEEIRTLRTTFNSMAGSIENDILERENIRQELVEARARAEHATQAKSMFLANMSHEIRTPLNAVIGMAELILHSRLSPRQRDYASKIRIAGRTLLDTLNDILDFSKIEAGRLELEAIPFRLEQVVANAFLLVERTALEKGVELLFEARPESAALLGERLLGDPLRIGQVLANLLSNAVKFTPSGHVSLRVDGKPAADGRYLVSLTVEDTGIGMRPDQIEHLFDDFVQADGATTRQYGGTGLGLAIVRRLVEAMGGEIRVQSVPRSGSSFHIQIPITREGDEPLAPLPPLPPMRVLVAEDYPEARLALIDLLNLQGIDDVEAVSSGVEAMASLHAARGLDRPYDLMFLDWSLPDLDGGAIMRALRDRPELVPAHIALMSVPRTLDEDVAELRPGGLHFCDRPLLPGTLRRLCNIVLGRQPNEPAIGGVATGALDGMRVLLVEDNATSRDVAVALLGRWGVEVDTAADGRDALAQLGAEPPDHYALVLMDLQMPVMDGYEAIRQIRARPEFNGLPVYALSAHRGRSVLEQCLALGMNGCLNKPYELPDLFDVLSRHHRPEPAPATPLFPVGGPAVVGLASVPGLDPHCAINDTGISPTLYPRLLAKFRVQFADGPLALRKDVEARDWEAVALSSHTLKGRAGLLGMNGIAAMAGRLESAARAGDRPRAQAALAELESQLRPLVEGLGRILLPDVAETDDDADEGPDATV
ncbi:response regulator [Zoogloea sp.]|jgi:signal transduction histidine kinase/DNA-binding response OmpR family regulator/HPt (histidine-containing phosphotransfer) domain-containing protein|uniref:hybrid sensor histidine kinase/response regulator n=1 Tax=Zoogloea sp. TaxID=49181 RepID=UPI0035B4D2AA